MGGGYDEYVQLYSAKTATYPVRVVYTRAFCEFARNEVIGDLVLSFLYTDDDRSVTLARYF